MIKVSTFILLMQLTLSVCLSQTVSVDMDINKTGIQDTMNSAVSGEEFFVQFTGSNFTFVSGYQFKVVFDTTKLQYLDIGQADDPMSGKMNILKQNGGTITGIFQRQANPKCDSILDIAYTINGTTDLSVSGTGLLGIAKFKSKLKPGETACVKTIYGYVASINGKKTEISECNSGFYKLITVQIAKSSSRIPSNLYQISCVNNIFSVHLPGNDLNCRTEIALYDLNGKQCAVLFKGTLSNPINTFSLENKNEILHNGYYICKLRIGEHLMTDKIHIK